MTRSPINASTTTRPNDHSTRTSQRHYATIARATSRQRLKIKNFTAHPRITIRWAAHGRHTRCAMSILEPSTTRPVVDLGKRFTDAEH
jgi:hypothetical protein